MQMLKFVFFLSISSAFGANFKLNFDSSDLEFDESIINVYLAMGERNGKTHINFNAHLLEDIKDNVNVHVEFFYKFNGIFHSATNNSMTFCKVLENEFVKLALVDLLVYSNFPKACPVLKKNYYLKNYVVKEDSLPPFSISPENKVHIQLTQLINGKQKSMAKVIIYIEMEADYHGSYARLPSKQRFMN